MLASLLGARLSDRIPQVQLRRGFGLFVLATGTLMILQETGLLVAMRDHVWIAMGVGGVLLLGAGLVVRELRRPAVAASAGNE